MEVDVMTMPLGLKVRMKSLKDRMGVSPKKAIAGAISMLSVLLVAALAFSCSAGQNDLELHSASRPITTEAADELGGKEKASASDASAESGPEEPESNDAGDDDNEGGAKLSPNEPSQSDQRKSNDASGSSPNANSGPSSSAKTAPAGSQQPMPSAQDGASAEMPKRWVEETEPKWVVDKEAWTEQVPVYVTVEKSICNVCGEDITGNTSAHGKAHMLAGEGSGHHSEVVQEISHYELVHNGEIGHWETVVVGGHWE